MIYFGVCQSSLAHLQLAQNGAALLQPNIKNSCHITPILALLHYLTMEFRVLFKMLLFVFKAVKGEAPPYFIHPQSRALRESDHLLLTVPKSCLISKGNHAFLCLVPPVGTSFFSMSDLLLVLTF